jgi:hypothetical protein
MAKESIAANSFNNLAKHAFPICKKCWHKVLPRQIKRNLQQAHCTSSEQAESAAEGVGSLAGLIQYASELEVPSQAVPYLPGLPDGFKGQLGPDRCRQIPRSMAGDGETLKTIPLIGRQRVKAATRVEQRRKKYRHASRTVARPSIVSGR